MGKLRNFIVVGVLAGSLVMFIAVNLVVSLGYQDLLMSKEESTSKNFVGLISNSIFQIMRRGGTRTEVNEYLKANEKAFKGTFYHIDMHRGKMVEDLYGRIEQSKMGGEIEEVFANGQQRTLKRGNTARYLHPLRAERECLGCHTNAKPGDVLGVIEIMEDLGPAMSEARKKIFLLLLLVSPIPIMIAFLAAGVLSNRISMSAELLGRRFQRVNKVKDLRFLEMGDFSFGFREFDDLFLEMKKIAKKLKETAVDKDVLEFEVRLLERFVITSEVVKDWKDHVKQILVEINRIMEAYFLFSLFLVGDENYDLEVFWKNTPSREIRDIFERIIREKLAKNPNFSHLLALRITHNVADTSAALPGLGEEDIDFQTKALILESPKIGGIVGIGVNSQLTTEPTRYLVIDSILTTLLNVVGSVKAIYKYTKDLEYFATRDPLTDLFNQRVFWELLYYETERSKRHEYRFALMVIDIDNFKTINDTYGHIFGDNYLREIASLLRALKRKEDILVRYGGDEFTAILPQADEEQAYLVAKRVMDKLKEFSVAEPDGSGVKVTASIGISVFPEHAQEPRDLFLLADNMMFRAKSLGKDRIGIPSQGDVAEVFRNIGEKNIMITRAIEEKRITPYFQ
ncbi:MAG TPA: GGDEF domain-containing protein, partial [Dissulfurispiraceae bacterium]